MRLLRTGIKIEPCGKAAISTSCNLVSIPGKILPVFLLRFQEIIDCLAVCSGNRRHIESRFHPPFDLQAVHPGLDQFRDMLNHAQILGIENISSAFIFKDRHVFPRPALLFHRIGNSPFFVTGRKVFPPVREGCFLFLLIETIPPSTRVGTGPEVGISAGHVSGEKTTP